MTFITKAKAKDMSFMFKAEAEDLGFPVVKAKAKDTVSSRTFVDSVFHYLLHSFIWT